MEASVSEELFANVREVQHTTENQPIKQVLSLTCSNK